ncbi:MAG: hypothetical protein ABIB46_00060 [bacterium]
MCFVIPQYQRMKKLLAVDACYEVIEKLENARKNYNNNEDVSFDEQFVEIGAEVNQQELISKGYLDKIYICPGANPENITNQSTAIYRFDQDLKIYCRFHGRPH